MPAVTVTAQVPYASSPPLRPSPSPSLPPAPPTGWGTAREVGRQQGWSEDPFAASSVSGSQSQSALEIENVELKAELRRVKEEKEASVADVQSRCREESDRLAKQARDQFREKLVWKQSSESWYDRYQDAVKSCTAVQEPIYYRWWWEGSTSGSSPVRRLRDLAVTALKGAVKG